VPELPEVETIRRGLEPALAGSTIEQVIVREPRLRWPIPPALAPALAGRRIHGLRRRGKYLIFALGEDWNGDRVIVHLGMSGRIFLLDPDAPAAAHDHVDWRLREAGGAALLLRYHDPRRFGAMLPWPAGDGEHALLRDMGPEPLSADFSGDYLHARAQGRAAAVKNFIMDGRVVVGVGNIYAAEALFRAGILPSAAAGKISLTRYRRLAKATRAVLETAIERGGTTLRDFRGSRGEFGYFQQELQVYGRAGEACRVCSTPIRQQLIGQRASCWCPRCQR
jgi:formamidopyrimidine-DNA glycosylase